MIYQLIERFGVKFHFPASIYAHLAGRCTVLEDRIDFYIYTYIYIYV